MAYLVFRHKGVPVLSIQDGVVGDAALHLAAYPAIRDEHSAGNVTIERLTTLNGIEIMPMPMTGSRLVEKDNLLKILADHEARIKALEGGGLVTKEEGAAALVDTVVPKEVVSR